MRLTVSALALLVAASTWPALAAPAPVPDRRLYPLSGRLNDDDLRLFLEVWGDLHPPGTRIPQWAPRFIELWRAGAIPGSPGYAPGHSEFQGPGGPQATVGPNINMTNNPLRIEAESFIAIDRANPMRLIAGANNLSGNAQVMFWSQDGGTTWGKLNLPLGGTSFHSDPGVGFDSRGIGYACALGIGGSVQVQVSRSTDGGKTWGTPSVPHAGSNDKELLAANHQRGTPCPDLVCVSWDEGNPGPRLHVACAPGGQPPWTDVIVTNAPVIGAVPAFGPDGEVYVAWTNYSGNDGPGLMRIDFARSDDCGQTWSLPIKIADVEGDLDLGIPSMCVRTAFVYPALDVDRSSGPRRGWIYAVWNDSAPGFFCPDLTCTANCSTNVYFSRSVDGGVTWSPAVTVHTDTPTVDQYNPWMAVDDWDGSVHVMWYDTRNDPAREKTDVYYRRSADGGLTWDLEDKITSAMSDESSNPGFQYGDYNGLAAFQCRSFPIWTDFRAGNNEQIYTAEVISSAPGVPPPDIGNTLRGVKDLALDPLLSWTDLGGAELDYHVWRGAAKDFVASPPAGIGYAGGGDVVTYTDGSSPSAPGVSYYKVRGVGDCGAEITTW